MAERRFPAPLPRPTASRGLPKALSAAGAKALMKAGDRSSYLKGIVRRAAIAKRLGQFRMKPPTVRRRRLEAKRAKMAAEKRQVARMIKRQSGIARYKRMVGALGRGRGMTGASSSRAGSSTSVS